MKSSPWMLLLLASCSTTGSMESADSAAVATDTLSVAEYANLEQDPGERDTTYTETLEVVSSFSGPQIKPTVAFVYSGAGLDVYAKNQRLESAEQSVLGHLDYKSKVTLIQPLVNNIASDTMIMEGLKGHLVEISFEGQSGFIFSGYLLNLPVPENSDIAVYFDQFLHMVAPAVRTRRECDCDGMFSE